MRTRTENFKNEIKLLGRQIDFKILLFSNNKLITQDGKYILSEDNNRLIVEQLNEEEVDETINGDSIYNVSVIQKGNILSSMMKEIDFEVQQLLRAGDIINCSFGLKVGNEYEWINYGKFIIYSVVHNEDTNTYSYVAYDSMLLSMIEVDDTSIVQNVTIKQAIENICSKVGLSVNITNQDITNLPNLNKIINSNTFDGIEMTYRDILDMICQCLGVSMIVEEKELKLKYFDNTIVDEFNEEYLSSTNVSFGEKYGPINCLTLSRSEDTDIIYRKDNESIALNGLNEFKIKDNLIMLYDDREDYIDEIFDQIKGLEFYINDFDSTGITYLEWLDFYNINRNGNIYKCLLLNDEIKITQGLKENIYAEIPKETTTDYKVTSKSDKEVSFIVDKQRGEITSKVSKDNVISTINQSAEQISINANKISLEGYTTINDGFSVDLEGNMTCNDSTMNNATMNNAVINGGNVELYDDGGTSSVLIYDENGIEHNVRPLQENDDLSGKNITLSFPDGFNGTSTGVSIHHLPLITFENGAIYYSHGYQYSDNTKIWLETEEENITLYDYYSFEGEEELRTNLSSIKLPNNIGKVVLIDYDLEDIDEQKMLIDYITYDFIETNNYSSVNSRGLIIKNDEINTYYTGDGLYIQNPDGNAYFNTAFGLNWQMPYGLDFSQFTITKDLFLLYNSNAQFYISSSNQNQEIDYTINSNAVLNANASRVWVNSLDQQSLESKKKNFEKYNENAIDIIKDIDIYKYHLKTQEDSEKKHIGFVIGDNYKYSQEITNNDNDSVDLYSFISLCCKAIQEQQEEIESLKRKIKSLKESDK